MLNNKKWAKAFVKTFILISFVCLQSCIDDSLKELNTDVVTTPNYEQFTHKNDISFTNEKLIAIQTNGLNSYMLGSISQQPFGKRTASFVAQANLTNEVIGEILQSMEDKNDGTGFNEDEKVLKVFMYLPFFSREISKEEVNEEIIKKYELDSIYGNKNSEFKIKVSASKTYIRELNPKNNLETMEIYYSDSRKDDYADASNVLAEVKTKISNEEVLVHKLDDDTKVEKRLSPGLKIELKKEYFQNIISKEGDIMMRDNNVFKEQIKGFVIETSEMTSEAMMLFDLSKAYIEIGYSYKAKLADSSVENRYKSYMLTLNGLAINFFENTNEGITDSDNIYLKGGERLSNINILTQTQLDKMIEEKWVITDAKLKLYVNTEKTNVNLVPKRLFVYEEVDGNLLALNDYGLDLSNDDPNASRTMHLGPLKKDDNNNYYYNIQLTNYLNHLLTRKRVNNISIVVAHNVNIIGVIEAKNANKVIKTSATMATTPLGVAIYGSNAPEEKKSQFEISYVINKN